MGIREPQACVYPLAWFLFLLFPALTQLSVSVYGWIISKLLLGCSLATICGHLFNNMLVWEGYTWNRGARQKQIGHTLLPACSIFRSATFEGLFCTDLHRCCLYQMWLSVRNVVLNIVIQRGHEEKMVENKQAPGWFVCCVKEKYKCSTLVVVI